MGDIRKKYDAALKAKIALEAVKGDKTIREISSDNGVHLIDYPQKENYY